MLGSAFRIKLADEKSSDTQMKEGCFYLFRHLNHLDYYSLSSSVNIFVLTGSRSIFAIVIPLDRAAIILSLSA